MGFTFVTHYCGGHSVETKLSLGNPELSCGMEETKIPCNQESPASTIKSKSCCENQLLSLSTEDNIKQDNIQEEVHLKFVFTFVHSYFRIRFSETSSSCAYSDYSTPLLRHNVQVLHQTFLI